MSILARNVAQREEQPEELWSQEQVAEYFGITLRTVRTFIANGDLPAARIAGKRLIRVRKSDALALLEPIPTTAPPAGR